MFNIQLSEIFIVLGCIGFQQNPLIVHIDIRRHITVLLQKAAKTAILLIVENLFGNTLGEHYGMTCLATQGNPHHLSAAAQHGADRFRLHQRHIARRDQNIVEILSKLPQTQTDGIHHVAFSKIAVEAKIDALPRQILLQTLSLVSRDHSNICHTGTLEILDHILYDR